MTSPSGAPSNPPSATLFSTAAASAGAASPIKVPVFNTLASQGAEDLFVPRPPATLEKSMLDETMASGLILKYLYFRGHSTGRDITAQIKMPFAIVERLLFSLRNQLLVGYRGSSIGGDYQYELTPKGVEQARNHTSHCTYYGAAPVSVEEYVESVKRQSLRNLLPNFRVVSQALEDLVLSKAIVSQVGQAIKAVKPLFLFGPPGNGKSSIARRMLRAVDSPVWIPRTIAIGGEIMRVFDPSLHEEQPLPKEHSILKNTEVDERWVRVKRPVVVVGGELNLHHLESNLNPVTGIIESPIHLKSNCGCLVIDDFGRQRIAAGELLNRWIVPLENGYDFLTLPSSRQLRIPFDQLIVFSTNLKPSQICDEAFLRRIPYKVQVFDPTEAQFRALWERQVRAAGFEHDPHWLDYLIENHYRKANRPFRFCHVDDLVAQVREFCDFHGHPRVICRENLEVAINNYFSTI